MNKCCCRVFFHLFMFSIMEGVTWVTTVFLHIVAVNYNYEIFGTICFSRKFYLISNFYVMLLHRKFYTFVIWMYISLFFLKQVNSTNKELFSVVNFRIDVLEHFLSVIFIFWVSFVIFLVWIKILFHYLSFWFDWFKFYY